MYSVAGLTAATAPTNNHAIAALWNPHATQRVKATRLSITLTAAPASNNGFRLRRISARGTPGSTITPDITSDSRNALAPPSGLLLDLAAYTVQPTLAGVDIAPGFTFAAVAASGLVWPMSIEIPPGTGLALIQRGAVITPIAGIAFDWLEDWQ